jgi:hypothetical protein
VALPFTLKRYLKAKEDLWKFKYFTMQKIYGNFMGTYGNSYLIFKRILGNKPKSFKIS